MQTDRTTGNTNLPDEKLELRVRDPLRHRSQELAVMAQMPAGEFPILKIWPIMAELGVDDRASYLSLRETLRSLLRGHAVRLRALKVLLRETRRLMPDERPVTIRAEIDASKVVFNALIALRRMAKNWSKAVRSGVLPDRRQGRLEQVESVLGQLADAVKAERQLRRSCRAAWDAGRDDARLEAKHGRAIHRVDALLQHADELKEN